MIKGIAFLFLTLLSPLLLKAQSLSAPPVERVVEIRNFSNEKHISLLTQLLNNVSEGSEIVLSCEEQGWVVFKLDPNEIHDDIALATILKSSGLEFFIKEGATRKEVDVACKGSLKKF